MTDHLPVPRELLPLATFQQPRGPVAPEEEGLRLRDVWGLLRRNRWLILSIAMLVAGAAVAYVLLATRIYEAAATIRIDVKEPNLPGIFQALPAGGGSEIGTEIQVFRSRSLVEDAIRELGLQMVITKPRHLPRSAVVTGVVVAPDALLGTYVLEQGGKRSFVLRRALDGAVLAKGDIGERIDANGISFTIASGASSYPRMEFLVQSLAETAERVSGGLAVSQASRDAQIVVLRYRDPDPQVVWRVPNTMAQRFIERRQEAQKTEARSTVAFLHKQLDTLTRQLATSENALRRFRERQQVVDPGVEASSQITRFVALQAERSTVEAERAALGGLLKEVQDSASHARPDQPSPYRRLLAFPTLLRNQSASDLLRTLSTLEDERGALLGRRTLNDPDVRTLSGRIAEVEEQLRLTVTTYFQGLTSQVTSFDTTVAQYSQQLARVPYKQLEFARLQRQPKVLEEMYSLLQTRLKEAEIAQAVEDPSVRIIDEAVPPLLPISPRRTGTVAAGLLVGLLLGVGLAFLRELMDRSVHTRADVLVATGLPVLGLIPRIPRAGRRLALIADLARGGRASARGIQGHQQPRPPAPTPQETYSFLNSGLSEIAPGPSADDVGLVYPGNQELSRGVSRATIQGIGTAVTEAYSSLQTNIMYSRGHQPVRTLVFTSALPGEGKTTNAVNLALTLAQRGIRVLIVDADLRRGVVHHVLGVPREPGLTEVLAGAIPLSAALHTVQVEAGGPLRILTSGAVPANPVATLESREMASLLTQLQEQFEVVILDAPPVNIITDAAILGANTDGVVIVARAGFTETGALEYAMHQLGLVHATALGVILNGIDFRRDAAYDSTYRYHQYSYKSGEKK